MAVGGTFVTQNKILPGAYINFVSVPTPMTTVGNRGIGIIPLSLSWGAVDKLIEVESSDLQTGESLAKVGFTASEKDSKLLKLMLQNCPKALVYRTNTNGEKAEVEIGDLKVTAIHPGALGNNIHISIVDMGGDVFEVNTHVNARQVDRQTVTFISDLKSNDFVEFSGDGELEEIAGEMLSGGSNGTTQEPSKWLSDFFEMADMAIWQTMAVPVEDSAISKSVLTFIDDQRNRQGKYVQAVVCNYDADHEGIINSTMGVVIDNERVEPNEFTAWVAGATAGAAINQSNTAKVVIGATDIIGEYNRTELEKAVQRGEFVVSRMQDGRIMVTQDINNLTSFTPTKDYAFSKNRVLRTLDEIGTTVKHMWETRYMGQVSNDETGRASLKGEIATYLESLQTLQGGGAIQNFNSQTDLDVQRGIALDAVVVITRVRPVDSMEKLYMTVNVGV